MNRNLSPGPPPKTPELDKRAPILEDANTIGAFLEWLTTTRKVILAEMRDDLTDHRPCYPCFGSGAIRGKEHSACMGTGLIEIKLSPKLLPVHPDFETLLAEYFEIDLAAVEAERRAILAHLRDAS